MSNEQIISNFKMLNNIPEEVELHTYAEWKRYGFQVKKGEHAFCKLALWIYHWNEKDEQDEKEGSKKNEKIGSGFTMKQSFLFTEKQVEKIN